jgi:hypothetical protein
VAEDHAGGEAVPVVPAPAQLVHHRRDEQRRVGDAPGHHHVGAARERLDDGSGAEVGDAEDDAVADGADVGAGVHVAQLGAAVAKLVDPRGDVVAGDGGHAQAAHAQLGSHLAHDGGCTGRVHATGVGDDADAPVARHREQRAHEGGEVASEPSAGVVQPILLEDRHGQLGERVAADVRDVPMLRNRDGAIGRVAVEALTGSDADGPHLLITRPTYTNGVSALRVRAARGGGRRRPCAPAHRWRS